MSRNPSPVSAHPFELTATEAIAGIRAGRLTAADWTRSCLARIREVEPALHAWTVYDEARALEQAGVVDAALRAGTFSGTLCGAPIGVKDVFNTFDFPTEMGSPIWKGFTPGNDARVVSSLRLAGGVVVGKTVAAEFAVHYPGPTVNPHDPEYSPGTSSSGSAAAVAAHMVPLALGTQTAGSTIRPASYCGVYGFKPSFGVIPRTGTLKTLDTLDHVSLFARSPEDLELMFEACRVRGANYPYVHQTLDAWSPALLPKPVRVAFVKGPVWQHAEPYAQAAIVALAESLGRDAAVALEEIALPPLFERAHETHELVYTKALSYYFRDEFRQHRSEISDMFREMCERGEQVSLEDYQGGLARQQEMQNQLDRFFDDFDVILGLSTSGHAPKGRFGRDKPDNALIWTLSHVPAVSVPLFTSPDGLPFGAQMVARRYQDLALLQTVGNLRARGLLVEWPNLQYRAASEVQ